MCSHVCTCVHAFTCEHIHEFKMSDIQYTHSTTYLHDVSNKYTYTCEHVQYEIRLSIKLEMSLQIIYKHRTTYPHDVPE